jgi:hypothetical protein
MQNLSLTAMKFGSQEDFKTAITELKWILKTVGKVSRRDFETVSMKYNFPTDFLKAGLKGLMLDADDYRISTSKWFPIVFSWDCQRKEVSDELFGFHVDFLSSRYSVIRTLALLTGMFQVLVIFLWNYLALDSLNLALLAISFALFIISLFFQMWDSVSTKNMALEKYRHHLRQNGLSDIIDEDNRFVRDHHKSVLYAPKIMKKKLEETPQVAVFSSHTEEEHLIIDDCEWPFEEYKKRMAQLESQVNTDNPP